MEIDLAKINFNEKIIFENAQFSQWLPLNDTIMGGSSESFCIVNKQGLIFKGDLIEEGGGFISCRSPLLNPPLELSSFKGIQIDLDGGGRTLKLALSCNLKRNIFSNLFIGNIRWVASLPTNISGTTQIRIPFKSFKPTIRAKKVFLPVNLDCSSITRFQLLYSKFGLPGEMNNEFKSGPIKILIRKIYAFY